MSIMRTQQCQRCKAPLSDDLNYYSQYSQKKNRHMIPEIIEETTNVKNTGVKDKPT